MSEVVAPTGKIRIGLHNDDITPLEFVVDLMRSVFDHTEAESRAIALAVDRNGAAVCGRYAAPVAMAKMTEAHTRARTAGHPLRLQHSQPKWTRMAACCAG
jgi:ATP-dependent Clp protease adapter protein ClpS